MGQKYCPLCGAALPEGIRFCEQCGSPVIPDSFSPVLQPASPVGPPSGIPPVIASPEGRKRTRPKIIVAFIFILLIIAAAVAFLILPNMSGPGTSRGSLPGSVTTVQTTIPIVTASPPTTSMTSSSPTPKPDPFPDALSLKERYPFGSGKVASEATVYNYWINDSYEWHNDMDNHYYVQKPRAGNKYLFVFVHLVNNGDTRVWFPPAGSVIVHYEDARYYQDQSHYKPDKASDLKATPVEVNEIQYFHKLNGDEYVEDFGFSHGTELAYLYPGMSNAVDGYIIYEVPQSLTPEKTYVEIPFNSQDRGVWRLG
jgi:zinc-ribbon domain